MEPKLKTITKASIPEAMSKAEHYRLLSEPEESESICQDILAIDPDNQAATRLLALAITDQFRGEPNDRYTEAEQVVQRLSSTYEREYCLGLVFERHAKAQMRIGRPPHVSRHLLQEAMYRFEAAEKISPPNNDDAMLRWNRCVRLLEALPAEMPRPHGATGQDDEPSPASAEYWRKRATGGS